MFGLDEPLVPYPIRGFDLNVGKAVFWVFLGLALLFVLSRTKKPFAIWKPLLLGIASIALVSFCIWQYRFGFRPAINTGIYNSNVLPHFLGGEFYTTGGIGIALLLLSAVQFRLSQKRAP